MWKRGVKVLFFVALAASAGCKGGDSDDTGDTDQQYQGARSVGPDAGWRVVRPQWTDSEDTSGDEQ